MSSFKWGIRRAFAAFAVFACLLPNAGLAPAQARSSSRPVRVRFTRGAMSAQVSGRLTRDKNADALFVVGAKSGDHMIVNIIPVTDGLLTSGEVTSPSGKQDGQHGGVVFNGDLTETGDYRIRVGRNLMGTERADGDFILEIIITPAYLKE